MARQAATARTRTSVPGSDFGAARDGAAAGTRRARGFTLIEIMIVMALIAIAVGVASLALRDPAAAQLDREAARLAALLEGARAESRASGVTVRFELVNEPPAEQRFRFAGLVTAENTANGWLAEGVSAEIIGVRSLTLGPEPLIGPQRIVLRLGERNLALATDGLGPFAPADPAAARP
ncbi:MAG: prepilin-type N-terminal cleavage/methylation domain-containing protein [Burkholderiaceae bacterium]|jgi:general secretion pathway protein H|nr:prepilin-type N-terminal cleavage/methylation domain-containing protein [Burkholderiaceae bacterium]